jgi:hypothetical protein
LEISDKTQDLADLTPEKTPVPKHQYQITSTKTPVPNYQTLGGTPESFWTFWRRGNLFSLVGEKNWGRPGHSLGVGATMIVLSLVLCLALITS